MLDVRETAQLVGRTPETVRRWIWSGRLTARRHGSKLLIARQDVADLVRGGQVPAVMTLSKWAEVVEDQRRAGALGAPAATASAADLVLEDRAGREAG